MERAGTRLEEMRERLEREAERQGKKVEPN